MSYSEREKTLDQLHIKAVARARCSSVRSSGNPSTRHWIWLCGSSAAGLAVGGEVSAAAVASAAGALAQAAAIISFSAVARRVLTGSCPTVGHNSVFSEVPVAIDIILLHRLTRDSGGSFSPGPGRHSTGSARARKLSRLSSYGSSE